MFILQPLAIVSHSKGEQVFLATHLHTPRGSKSSWPHTCTRQGEASLPGHTPAHAKGKQVFLATHLHTLLCIQSTRQVLFTVDEGLRFGPAVSCKFATYMLKINLPGTSQVWGQVCCIQAVPWQQCQLQDILKTEVFLR